MNESQMKNTKNIGKIRIVDLIYDFMEMYKISPEKKLILRNLKEGKEYYCTCCGHYSPIPFIQCEKCLVTNTCHEGDF